MTAAVATGFQKFLESETAMTPTGQRNVVTFLTDVAKQALTIGKNMMRKPVTSALAIGGFVALSSISAPVAAIAAAALYGASIGGTLVDRFQGRIDSYEMSTKILGKLAFTGVVGGAGIGLGTALGGGEALAQTPDAEVLNPEAHDGKPTRVPIGTHPYGSGYVMAYDNEIGKAWLVAGAPGMEEQILDEWVRGDGTNSDIDRALNAQEARNARGPMFRMAPTEYTPSYPQIDLSNFGRSITEVQAELDAADGGEKMFEPKVMTADLDGGDLDEKPTDSMTKMAISQDPIAGLIDSRDYCPNEGATLSDGVSDAYETKVVMANGDIYVDNPLTNGIFKWTPDYSEMPRGHGLTTPFDIQNALDQGIITPDVALKLQSFWHSINPASNEFHQVRAALDAVESQSCIDEFQR